MEKREDDIVDKDEEYEEEEDLGENLDSNFDMFFQSKESPQEAFE